MQRESYMFCSWSKDLIKSLQLVKIKKLFELLSVKKSNPVYSNVNWQRVLVCVCACVCVYIYIRRYVQDPNRIWDVYLDQHLIQLMFCILYFHFLVFYKKRDNSCQESFVFITGCVSVVKEGAPANMIHGLDNGLLKLPKLPNFLFPHFFFCICYLLVIMLR